jgi:hypothetical protein
MMRELFPQYPITTKYSYLQFLLWFQIVDPLFAMKCSSNLCYSFRNVIDLKTNCLNIKTRCGVPSPLPASRRRRQNVSKDNVTRET